MVGRSTGSQWSVVAASVTSKVITPVVIVSNEYLSQSPRSMLRTRHFSPSSWFLTVPLGCAA